MTLNRLFTLPPWIAGIQWFFFIFVNIIIIPITVGEAFQLQESEIASIMRVSFIVTGLACLAQVFLGHKRPILEGQSGLWWGIFLTLVTTASAQGMSLVTLGGSLSLGVILSGIITIIFGITGMGSLLGKLFKPGVMGVFVLLLGFTLIHIFLKGMLGIPFGVIEGQVTIDIPVAMLSIFIALLVIIISIKSPVKVKSYALLIGIVIGWIIHRLLFGAADTNEATNTTFSLFPLGKLTWDSGIVLTAVLAGILNLTNTFGALKGSDNLFKRNISNKEYGLSLTITGTTNIASGILGLVPYAPYVSSIGFLRQTNIYDRLPFMIGSFLFLTMGIFPFISSLFIQLPLSIGSAVLFVAYSQLFLSSFEFLKQIVINSITVYRVAIPVFFGVIIMMFSPEYFVSIPTTVRPFLSNGLLVGIILSIAIENIIDWDRLGNQ